MSGRWVGNGRLDVFSAIWQSCCHRTTSTTPSWIEQATETVGFLVGWVILKVGLNLLREDFLGSIHLQLECCKNVNKVVLAFQLQRSCKNVSGVVVNHNTFGHCLHGLCSLLFLHGSFLLLLFFMLCSLNLSELCGLHTSQIVMVHLHWFPLTCFLALLKFDKAELFLREKCVCLGSVSLCMNKR